jgi:DNA-binding NtrC family response regulator
MGYKVVQASDGDAALRLLAAEPKIRLLFTDVVMPGMDGFVLAHEAKQLRPDLRVVYTSGYLKNLPWGQHGIGYGPMVEKPWNMERLRAVLRHVFDDPEPKTC